MNPRLFAAAAVVLAGAGGLNAVNLGGGVAALLAAPAHAADTAGAAEDFAAPDDFMAAGPLPAPEGPADSSFSERIGASADEYRILISLQQRRRELEAWEAEIDTRAQLVAAAEQRMEERLTELRGVRTEIDDLLGQLDEQEETRIASLVSTYQRMKAKDAARVLAALDDRTAMMVLSRMRDANLAAVLGEMNTADAMRMTEMLARRADLRAVVGPAPESGDS